MSWPVENWLPSMQPDGSLRLWTKIAYQNVCWCVNLRYAVRVAEAFRWNVSCTYISLMRTSKIYWGFFCRCMLFFNYEQFSSACIYFTAGLQLWLRTPRPCPQCCFWGLYIFFPNTQQKDFKFRLREYSVFFKADSLVYLGLFEAIFVCMLDLFIFKSFTLESLTQVAFLF